MPFKVAGVKSDLHEHGAACIQVTSFDGDPRSSGQGPRGRLHAGEVRRLAKEKLVNRVCWMRKNKSIWMEMSPDHEGEGLGGDSLVVLVDTVSDAHFHLGFLHPVTRGVVQSTHDPEKQSGAGMSFTSTAVKSSEQHSRGSESRSTYICMSLMSNHNLYTWPQVLHGQMKIH